VCIVGFREIAAYSRICGHNAQSRSNNIVIATGENHFCWYIGYTILSNLTFFAYSQSPLLQIPAQLGRKEKEKGGEEKERGEQGKGGKESKSRCEKGGNGKKEGERKGQERKGSIS